MNFSCVFFHFLYLQGDKNSIIRMAAKKIEELQRCAKEMRRRNLQVQASLASAEGERVGGAKIRLRVAEPASGVDSMLEVLRCLKAMGLKTRTIRSNFSAQEFSAELEIETEVPIFLSLMMFRLRPHLYETSSVIEILCKANAHTTIF